MKKYLLGVITGITVTAGTVVFADGFVGKTVDAEFPIKIENQQLAQNAISIEGTSYVPIREVGRMFGYHVYFEDNTITLSKGTTDLNTDKQGMPSQQVGTNDFYDHKLWPQFYRVKTSEFEQSYDPSRAFEYYEIDGEQYISANAFGQYARPDGYQFGLHIPGKFSIFIMPLQKYSKGIAGFNLDGRILIKLSALGYKAEKTDKDGLTISAMDN